MEVRPCRPAPFPFSLVSIFYNTDPEQPGRAISFLTFLDNFRVVQVMCLSVVALFRFSAPFAPAIPFF